MQFVAGGSLLEQHHVRFEFAVQDPGLVCVLERVGGLTGNLEGLQQGDRLAGFGEALQQ